MKKFLFTCILLSTLVFSCHYGTIDPEGEENSNLIMFNPAFFADRNLSYPDQLVIPDKYNTGVESSVTLKKITQSENINGLFITHRVDSKITEYEINSYNENHVENRDGTLKSEMADSITIENYDFSDMPFVVLNGHRFSRNKTVTFKNCKFASFRNPPNEDNHVWIYFDHCTFKGGVNEAQIIMDHCYIGGFTADAINPTRYFRCTNTYIADLVTKVTDKEVHIDGFQAFGRANIAGGNIYFNNVRFEIPSIHIDNQHSGTGVNACVMFQLEYGNVDNCLFQNLFVNGGGKWFPIYLTNGKNKKGTFSQTNLTLKNVHVSNNFGKIFYSGSYDENARVINVAHRNSIYVSSVWKSDDGKTHIICSNDTIFESTLLVKTDKGNFEFIIPRCPSNWNLEGLPNGQRTPEQKAAGLVDDPDSCLKDKKGKSYTQYKFSDMPFDIDCVIEEDVSEITCFDKEENVQIRHVKF